MCDRRASAYAFVVGNGRRLPYRRTGLAVPHEPAPGGSTLSRAPQTGESERTRMIAPTREQYFRAVGSTGGPSGNGGWGGQNLMTILVVHLERAIPLSMSFAETA